MTSHLLHETEDQLIAISHLACEALEEMYRASEGRATLTDTDISQCCNLWYVIQNIGDMNRFLYDYSTGVIGITTDEPVTGDWRNPDDDSIKQTGAHVAQQGWSDVLKNHPGVKLSGGALRWVIGLTSRNTGAATSGRLSRVLVATQDRLEPLYAALKRNYASMKRTRAFTGQNNMTGIDLVLQIHETISCIEYFLA